MRWGVQEHWATCWGPLSMWLRTGGLVGGVAGDDVFVDCPGDAVVGAGVFGVAGAGTGAAPVFLADGLLGRLFDVEADPVCAAGVVERCCGGGLDSDGGAEPGAG